MKNLFANLKVELNKVEQEVMAMLEAKDIRISELEAQVTQLTQMMQDVRVERVVDALVPVQELALTQMEVISSKQVEPVIAVPTVAVPVVKVDDMVHDEIEDIEDEAPSAPQEAPSTQPDPFANVPVKAPVEAKKEGVTMPTNNPFANVPVKEPKGVETPQENPFLKNAEVNKPVIQTSNLLAEAPQRKKKAGAGEVSAIQYTVNGSKVMYVKKSMFLNSIKDKELADRVKAFNKNFVIPKEMKNSEDRQHKAIVHNKKLLTQFLRDYAMEIAAANNISYVLGDAGAAYLVVCAAEGLLAQPKLTARNQEERNLYVGNYQAGMNDRNHLVMMFGTIKPFIDLMGINIHNVHVTQEVTPEVAAALGTSLLFSRLSIADANVATAYRYESSYHKEDDAILVKADVEQQTGLKLLNRF